MTRIGGLSVGRDSGKGSRKKEREREIKEEWDGNERQRDDDSILIGIVIERAMGRERQEQSGEKGSRG